MDDPTKTGSAMQLANQLIAETQTEAITANEINKENEMADTTTRNIFNATPGGMGSDGLFGGFGGNNGGGLLGGLILGSILRNGNGGLFGSDLYGGRGDGVNTITQQMLSQDLGDIKAGVATSALETQKAVAASNMDINQTLFNQSAAIQQQIGGANLATAAGFSNTNQNISSAVSGMKDAFSSGLISTNQNMNAGFSSNKDAIVSGTISGLQSASSIMAAAAANHSAIEKSAAELALGVERAGNHAVAATMAASNASALQNAALQGLIDRNSYSISNKISEDGEKTRDLIVRQYEATLNRQLTDANAEIIELRNEGRLNSRTRDIEVNVNNTLMQNQNQLQAQAQLQSIAGAVSTLANEVQRNSSSIINLGGALNATNNQSNTRVN